jgi:hypothetical protein
VTGRWRRRLGESQCSGAASVAGYADKGNGCSATRFVALEGKGKVSHAEGLKRGASVAFAPRQRMKWRLARHQDMEEEVGVQPVLCEGLEARNGKGGPGLRSAHTRRRWVEVGRRVIMGSRGSVREVAALWAGPGWGQQLWSWPKEKKINFEFLQLCTEFYSV